MTKEKFIEQQTKNYLADADSSYLPTDARTLAENDWKDYQRMWTQQTKKDFYRCFINW